MTGLVHPHGGATPHGDFLMKGGSCPTGGDYQGGLGETTRGLNNNN